jgi:tetratricopeptide (TPR) repeat protein
MTSPMTETPAFDYDVFVSYNEKDQTWAENLSVRLEREDWNGRKLKVFFAPWEIRPGESVIERLESALPKSRKVCLIMTPEAHDSVWTTTERYATLHIDITTRQNRLIPLFRRECVIPTFLEQIRRVDFRDDDKFESSYRVLLAAIREEALPRGPQRHLLTLSLALPIPRPPMVGFVARRDHDGQDIVARLKKELNPRDNRLIVLSGPGGVGKTTLAAEAARVVSEEHQCNIVWIGADGREDTFSFSTLLNEIAIQLGRDDLHSEAESGAAEVAALVTANPTLIVLDNFETIAKSEQIRCYEFLANRAHCPALITTRQRIPNASNMPIPVMSPEEADNFLQRLIEQASDRSAFEHMDRDRIMKASERNPLVLQWVVAQIDLAQDSETVLDELMQGVGDAAQRVFDRSFNLEDLGDDGRAALLALSLFAPDASRTVLAEVAGFGEDPHRLNEAVKRLASQGLVQSKASGQRLAVEGLTRKLAKARLSKSAEARAFLQRYVRHFLSYTKGHRRALSDDFDALEIEMTNLLNAADIAFEMEDWTTVIELIESLTLDGVNGFLPARGYMDEARRGLQQALDAATHLISDSTVARFSHTLAIVAQAQGDFVHARRLLRKALQIYRRRNNLPQVVTLIHDCGRLEQAQGELEEARRLYQDGLEISQNLDDQAQIAVFLHDLGRLARAQDQLEDARRLYNQSLEIKKHLRDEQSMAVTLHQLATLAHDLGELEEARQRYGESLEIAKRTNDEHSVAITLHQLGRLAAEEDKNPEALQMFREAIAIFTRLESPDDAEMARRSLNRVERKSPEAASPRAGGNKRKERQKDSKRSHRH